MYCKYCGTELEENSTVCVNCGEVNGEKPKKQMPKWLKITLVSVGGLALTAALVAMVYYGLYGTLKPRANDVYYKDNYSVSNEKVGEKFDEIVATMGEEKLNNRQLQLFYWMHVYNYSSYYGVDMEEPFDKQVMDEDTGMTYQQYFIECAMISWQQYHLLTTMAEKENFELPEEYQELLDGLEDVAKTNAEDAGFATVNEMMEADFGKGITFEDYKEYFRQCYLGSAYFGHLVESEEVTQAEMDAYFEKNGASLKTEWGVAIKKDMGKLVDVRHILVVPEGGKTDEKTGTKTYSDDEWEACRKKAQELYDEWLKGDKDEGSFADLAYEETADGNYGDGGLYTDISKGVMVTEFEDWCFDESREYGNHGLVKTKYGYHIMYFVGAEDGYVRYCTNGVLNERAGTLLDELLEANPVEINYKAIALTIIDFAKK